MDFSTGKLLWPDTLSPSPRYPALEEDIACDVLIIGGGVAGALCSYYLNKSDVRAVLVDKRTVCSGSSSANTGMLQYANDKSLTSCIHTFGEKDGARFYRLCRQAVGELGRISSELDANPEFRKRSSLYVATEDKDVDALKKEYELLKAYGYPVQYWEPETIARHFSFAKPGAIFSEGDADFNPYRFVVYLIRSLHRQGLRVYEHTEVASHVAERDRVIFRTKNGRTITARHAVIATGYEAQKLKKNHNAVAESTYAIATQRLRAFPGWHEQCLIWETARPFLYIRTTMDNRIVVGGLDDAARSAEQRDSRLPGKRDALLAEAVKLFPALEGLRAEYFWSAAFCSTHDGLPLIGPQEEFPHCYFALGYGGNGTVYCTIAAQIISSLITNGSHPDMHLFRFDRPRRDPGHL
ncbi:FAD-binding oxidoreductase [Paenibacillus doosanensis]|uniref:Gamma-glutamylputrescine oxidoreductase n=1 Tax=Paenibacillus konkukensis TaxID=2020716 RepID=A0ABY4RHK6_9BACL|nr:MULTISPECIES: FAD-dependent oxidoreductase [Paenibacillus]MCS7462003.1 FAD-binding oxidoreductase [Paenibacillus doosanensis]UQZ81515.1 Gamma-glutamylputrescine oxidoreductase [Paenibacillus konkukensis]